MIFESGCGRVMTPALTFFGTSRSTDRFVWLRLRRFFIVVYGRFTLLWSVGCSSKVTLSAVVLQPYLVRLFVDGRRLARAVLDAPPRLLASLFEAGLHRCGASLVIVEPSRVVDSSFFRCSCSNSLDKFFRSSASCDGLLGFLLSLFCIFRRFRSLLRL